MNEKQITDIAGDLDCGLRVFVNKDTKKIVTIINTEGFYEDEDDEFRDEANDEIDNNTDKYIEVEKMESFRSFRIMEDFVETVDDEKLRDRLIRALNKRKPFSHFKDEIDNSGPYRQKWFDFKNQQLYEWVKDQVEASGL